MSKLTTKIAIPIILVGVFAIAIFLTASYEQSGRAFNIIIIFFAIYVFFFGISIGQNLTSPVKKLLEEAKELSRGNLSSRVYIETKDEFSELAKVFNQIAEKLQVSYEQEANIEKSVGIKVQAKTKELEEVINALEQKVKNRTIELERLIGESNKFQESVKNKEAETSQLRKELNDIKQKVSKGNKIKQEAENNNL